MEYEDLDTPDSAVDATAPAGANSDVPAGAPAADGGAPLDTAPSTPAVDSLGVDANQSVAVTYTPWDGKKDTLQNSPWFQALAPEIQAAILPGVDTVEATAAQAAADREAASAERAAAEAEKATLEALTDLLLQRDAGSVDVARELLVAQSRVEALTSEASRLKQEYDAQLAQLTSQHSTTAAEREALAAAKAELDASMQQLTAERDELRTGLEAARAAEEQRRQETEAEIMQGAQQRFFTERPDLSEKTPEEKQAIFDQYLDLLGSAHVALNHEKAMKILAIDHPLPPAPDPVPAALAEMNNESRTLATSLAGVGVSNLSNHEQWHAKLQAMEIAALNG